MPRIRKKTSNRQATRDRAKVTKKVAEYKKKSKRDTKRNTTWKSKKKADIGVPSSFHLKDQVLAEMAQEKRLAIEAKQNRKKGTVEEEEDAPGISSIAGSAVLDRVPLTATATLPVEADSDDDVPALFDSDLPTLQAALDAADILLEVVDARDIAGGRSAAVETLVSEAEGLVFIVVNKVDLVPREALEGWLAVLPFPTFLFSARENLGREQLLAALAAAASGKDKGEPLKAALLGLPNVGKTSIINSLLGKDLLKAAPAVSTAAAAKSPNPTTTACREVEVKLPSGGSVQIIDTPGWEYVEDDDEDDDDEDLEENIVEDAEEDDDEEDDEDTEDAEDAEDAEDKWDALETRVAGDLLRRNLGRVDRVKDVFPLVNYIVTRSNAQDLMLKYNVPYFEEGDVEAFLTGLARVNQRVKKHGDPNHDAAARILLADWSLSRFPYYTTAPKDEDAQMEMDDEDAMGKPDMTAVLEQCKSRKELKAAGLVRFESGEVDTRDIFLDDDYTDVAAAADSDDDEDEDDEAIMIGSDEGEELELEDGEEPSSGSDVEEDDDDEEDSESEEEVPVRAGKRKAPASPEAATKKAKINKSVSFNAKLEAPKSFPRKVKEVKSILKRKAGDSSDDDEPAAAPAPKKARAVVVQEKKAAERKVKEEKKKVAAPPKKKTSGPINPPLPKPVVKELKERKTPEERRLLREAKKAAKADKPKAAPVVVAAPAPVAAPKGKKGKKEAAPAPVANGKSKKASKKDAPVAPGAYDFSKHF